MTATNMQVESLLCAKGSNSEETNNNAQLNIS
jgi:hypothetical protein